MMFREHNVALHLAQEAQAQARFARLTCERLTDLLDALTGLSEEERGGRRELVRRETFPVAADRIGVGETLAVEAGR